MARRVLDASRIAASQFGRRRSRGDVAREGRQPPTENYMESFAYMFYEWNKNDPTDISTPRAAVSGSGLRGSRSQKGFRYATIWEPFLRARTEARGRPWSPGAAVLDASGDDITEVRYWTAFSGGTRGTSGSHTWVEFYGEINLDVAAAHKVVMLGNAAPLYHMQKIASKTLCETECITGLQNFESINQRVESYLALEPARLVSRGFPVGTEPTSGCAADGLNRYGCPVVDQVEGDQSGLVFPTCAGSPSYTAGVLACPHDAGPHAGLPANAPVFTKHVWSCDVTSTTYQDALVAAWRTFSDLYTDGGTWRIKGLLVDLMNDAPQTGQATTAYPVAYTATLYRAGWRSLTAKWLANITASGRCLNLTGFRWANCTDLLNNYSVADMPNRFVEGFFIDPSGNKSRRWTADPGDPVEYGIQNALERIATSGMRAVLAYQGAFRDQDTWAQTSGGESPAVNGTWAMIASEVNRLQSWRSTYVNTLRTNTIGYMFHQEGIRPPVVRAGS